MKTQPLQTLRAFVTVAREGSVSRAAERLHLSQPAVSLKLKQLQQDLGLTLFERRPQGLALTADGQALLPSAEQALAAMAAFEQSARALHSLVRGRLRIGTIVDPEFIRLGAFLNRLMERAPLLETGLRHGMSGSVLRRVRAGELDAGFFLAPPGVGPGTQAPEVAFRELARFDYYVVAPPGWAGRTQATDWRSLAALPWIVTPEDSVHHRLLRGALEPLGLRVNAVAEVDQEACMLDLVRAGVGLSLARDALAMAERQERGLVVVEGVRLPCALSFVWPRERQEAPAMAAALEALTRVWGGT
ncbi:LysR family transcriptional regulator [Marinobacter lutaoensis]|jgi:DNA-binding transcriptional LysR family regulator|uniref:LysR family transcriptional regulator n=1 Tax=Marinobacter lutaoensis TaxID=135739 RepID=A0A1V2DRI6_9GAMM|nr:LysR family transcriptional regulator [Marinobacter lutaoensis]MBE03268.1 LysR family transcriptional regulator [Marinobacter sp.]MBI44219.1 LysR family transcriptional regulator [Oceanospirillales bacterium]NVD36151.1 LysR family transcriptional regulator [Marinobacter lutaoensis]ONF43006.1 LysR family transcriptional regulator [Marinobacter lutaoensis]|tara:strand:- start:19 stop:927 length:909 start_codon:yes stop_codon:yes gene_type:complete